VLSERRLREDVEVHSFLDPDLEVVLKARNSLSDPDNWIQGHFGRVNASAGVIAGRPCRGRFPSGGAGFSGHLLKAGATVGDRLHRIALKLGFKDCSEMVQFNDTHTHAEVLARVDEGIGRWVLCAVNFRSTDQKERELVC
jgi:hypothetical protein